MRAPDPASPEAGFTLIEALVALAILAIVATTVLELSSTGLQRVVRADQDGRAARLAESLLAGLDASPDGATSGTTPDGLAWAIERSPWRDPSDDDDGQPFSDPSASAFARDDDGEGAGTTGGFGDGAGSDSGLGSNSGGGSGFGEGAGGDSGFGRGGRSDSGFASSDDADSGDAEPTTAPLSGTAGPLESRAAPTLWRVAVRVDDPRGRRVELVALRLGAAAR